MYKKSIYGYIFYRVYRFYENAGDEHPGIYSLGVLTVLQFFGLLGLITIIFKSIDISVPNESKSISISIGFFMLLFNYLIIYKRIGVKELFEYWDKAKNISMLLLFILHLILSMSLLIISGTMGKW